jgi:hypothetical protein
MGRPINGLEYILDENGHEVRFADEAAALDFLRGKGYTDDAFENSAIVFPGRGIRIASIREDRGFLLLLRGLWHGPYCTRRGLVRLGSPVICTGCLP